MKKVKFDLTPNEATTLRLVYLKGQEKASTLINSIGISKSYGLRILGSLKHKGLIRIKQDYDGLRILVSAKGRALAKCFWPEIAQSIALSR